MLVACLPLRHDRDVASPLPLEKIFTLFGVGNAMQILELVGEHKRKKVEFHFYQQVFTFLMIFGVTLLKYCQYYFVTGPCIKYTRRKFIKNLPETFRGGIVVFSFRLYSSLARLAFGLQGGLQPQAQAGSCSRQVDRRQVRVSGHKQQ